MTEDRIRELEQELEIRINDNADIYAKLCNALMQLEEANEVIKKYSKLEDLMSCAIGLSYEEPPAKNYLKKWSV